MSGTSPRLPRQTSRIAWVAAGLGTILILFLIENLWIDARLRHRSHRIPSFIPEAQSAIWFLAFAAIAIGLVLLIACLILLLRDSGVSLATKAGTGAMVLLVLLLGTEWTMVTNGQQGMLRLNAPKKARKIVVTWQASSSPVVGYNVYRKGVEGFGYLKLNSTPIQGLTYTDSTAENGVNYSYVARAVDSHGVESANSNVSLVAVP
jgi:hypothetical protein